MKPKIGIVVCGLMDDRQFVTNTYIQSVRYSGGLPFILPLIRSDHAIQEYIAFCDGFLAIEEDFVDQLRDQTVVVHGVRLNFTTDCCCTTRQTNAPSCSVRASGRLPIRFI